MTPRWLKWPALATAGVATVLTLCCAGPAAATGPAPDLARASAYLTSSARLHGGHYYESFPGFADFGLTIDGALALAASGRNDPALKKIVDFLNSGGKDGTGQSIDDWTLIGTGDVSGGSLGKEALLAEVTGYNPTRFGGHNLLTALDGSVCTASVADVCAAPGNYRYATSVFSQSLAVIAQLRGGHVRQAAGPIAYLEHLQNAAGAWPSLIPGTGADVDSTAVAVQALSAVGDATARAAATKGLNWLAHRQSPLGGFPGVSPNSVNSTALAVQALSLKPAAYVKPIASARAFLASEQNSDGGFNSSPAVPGSDLRASAQAVSGSVGTSFATLSDDVSTPAPSTPPVTSSASLTVRPTASRSTMAVPSAQPTATRSPLPTPSSRARVTSASTAHLSAAHRTAARSTAATRFRRAGPDRGAGRIATAPTAGTVDGRSASATSETLADTGARTAALPTLAAVLIGLGSLLIGAGRRRPRPGGRHR